MNITSSQLPEHVMPIPSLHFFTLDFLNLECSLSFSLYFSGQDFFKAQILSLPLWSLKSSFSVYLFFDICLQILASISFFIDNYDTFSSFKRSMLNIFILMIKSVCGVGPVIRKQRQNSYLSGSLS